MKVHKSLVLALLLACGSSMVMAAKGPAIRIGIDTAYPPFASKNAAGKLQGLDIDILNAVCKKLDAQCSWVETPFDKLISGLLTARFDLIGSSLNITEERAKSITFTDPMYSVPVQLVAARGSNLQPTPAALKAKRVGVLKDSVSDAWAKAHLEPYGVTLVQYPTQDKVYLDLISGKIDASLQDSQAAYTGFLKTAFGNGYSFAGGPLQDNALFGTGMGLGLRKSDTALHQQINDALKALKADGTLDRIAHQYTQITVIKTATAR
ncbi:transporter substrate-binding domain-containing protein [Silvimonas amylolytica]|uniref:ABC transporter substrate-binding protein n=1 Tax=Silvimonas amylolytica TaxID=449663 RepID=A0ABQ2PGF7_9NEIS|nr:transporter substrate-binding domain-containing protein [Silvimonas amylolytica]GGP24643.1 ABC transporter substrate-binding protein [Silvimonas amylolytica]